MEMSEDEVAFKLLKGDMEDVVARYGTEEAVAETLANVVVGGGAAKRLNDRMVGDIDTTWAVGKLLDYGFIDGLQPTPLGRAVTRHFLSPTAAFQILDGVRHGRDPFDVVADLELADGER
jgi:helicase